MRSTRTSMTLCCPECRTGATSRAWATSSRNWYGDDIFGGFTVRQPRKHKCSCCMCELSREFFCPSYLSYFKKSFWRKTRHDDVSELKHLRAAEYKVSDGLIWVKCCDNCLICNLNADLTAVWVFSYHTKCCMAIPSADLNPPLDKKAKHQMTWDRTALNCVLVFDQTDHHSSSQ